MIIYKITNKVNGKVYIGQTTKTLEHRWKGHIQASKDGVDYHLYRAFRKYGIENFEIEQIDSATTIEELNYLETKYIVEYDSVRSGYNMCYGGDNNCMFSNIVKNKHDNIMRSRVTKAKISNSMKKYREENPFTEEHRKKISDKMKGNQHYKGHKRPQSAIEATGKALSKKVYCIDEQGNVIRRFDYVRDAAIWWRENGGPQIKSSLCDYIKKSNAKDIYINGLKWIYE